MSRKKPWKLESIERLSSKIGNSPNTLSPIEGYNSTPMTDSEKEELEGFSIGQNFET